MKSISLILVVIFIFSLSAFAQDTSFAVSSNGDVGIGTTNPQAKLDVRGDIITGTAGSGGSLILNSRDNSTLGGMIVWKGAASYQDWGQENYYDNMRVYSNSSGNSNFQIFSNGGGITNLNVQGEIQTQPTGDANMVPIAYGTISNTGTKYAGSTDNFTVSKIGTGHYEISIVGGFNFTTHVVSCSVYGTDLAFINYYDIGTVLRIKTYDNSGVSTDKYFNFIVYKK